MRRILAIFRKDARHLWPQAAALAVLMALAALFDPAYTGWPRTYYDWLPSFALPLMCWLLVVSAIHEEKLPGDRQYWLTRPYSRKELITAKVLFIAAFVNLPLLAYHAGVYVAVGIPLADHLAPLFWRQVFFTAFYILPAAALAAITRSLGRTLAIALAGGLSLWAGGMAFMLLMRRPLLFASDAAATILPAALLAVGVSVILALQYTLRRTAVAGAVAAVVAVVCLATATYDPQSRAIAKETARLVLDLGPDRHSEMRPASDPDLEVFDIPVRLDGAPAGIALDRAYCNVRIDLPGKGLLRSPQGELHGLSGGRGWLSFSPGQQLLRQTGEKPVSLSGSFDLRLFGDVSVLPLPRRSAVAAPGVGVCRSSGEGPISFLCYSPWPRTAVMAGIPGVRANWIVTSGTAEVAGAFQPVEKFTSLVSYTSWEQVGDMKLITARPLPPVRVSFRLDSVLLRDYLVRDRRQ